MTLSLPTLEVGYRVCFATDGGGISSSSSLSLDLEGRGVILSRARSRSFDSPEVPVLRRLVSLAFTKGSVDGLVVG